MSAKAEKPVLQGQRIKTRKRDEKAKYDPSQFRDAVVQGLNQAGPDFEQISKFLDTAGNKLDYRNYAETLFDILIAGGILEPGGTVKTDPDPTKASRAKVSVFTAQYDYETLKSHAQVLNKLIRRYKYLEKAFQEEMRKILVFLKGFSTDERANLAMLTGILLSMGLLQASVLASLFQEHLVKEGIAIQFAINTFKSWLRERDTSNLITALRKAQLDNRLLELLPINKRSHENLSNHLATAGLATMVEYQKSQQNVGVRKELQQLLEEMLNDQASVKEVIATVREHCKKHNLADHEVVILTWNTVMASTEWSKKEDMVVDQALKHVKIYSPLFSALTTNQRAELALLIKIQEYCYDNMNFMKAFQKIVVLLYKTDVLSEDTILKWYKDAHSSKGKSIFLEQMKKFVEWLQNAEEESDEESEGDEEEGVEDDDKDN